MIETDFSSNVTVYTADLLITDWSSIAVEYSFTTNKPTCFVNTQMKVVNLDYQKIPIEAFDIALRNQIGCSIEKDEVKKAAAVVADLLTNGEQWYGQIEKLKDDYFYNLGHSGEVGAQYIINRLNRKHNNIKM